MDLSRIPREELEGLNRGEVEGDRKKYWEKFFEKYEQIGAACTTTVGIEEMDMPDVVAGLVRAEKRVKLEMPVSKTFRKWVKEHGEEIDELATIAGPPSVDEEELSDDEDDSDDDSNDESDDLADMIDDTENNPPIPDQSLSLSPPSSPLLSLLDQSDSDSDLLLYSSTLPSSSHSIFAPPSVNLSYKDKLLFSPQLYSSRNNSSAASPTPPHKYLICSSCSKQSLYSTLLGLDQSVFQCDSCMLTDTHSGCGEECGQCRKIAAVLDARWIHRDLVESQGGQDRSGYRDGDVGGREEEERCTDSGVVREVVKILKDAEIENVVARSKDRNRSSQ
eukprot:GFUD01058188.1.p1 GENE.GFUD01058188.1~~GFUD01058188.1.p1  ORF type:complete len:334 (-),score=153.06 GFUD01058188.1:181-1182(-)